MATEAGTQAIDRAAQLLVRVVESPQPLGVNELDERSGLPRSTRGSCSGSATAAASAPGLSSSA